ncbi:MAG: elongation factor Ts [Deltaproteobacteria bacterium]|nr:elongation factor Ts [Deltaproteobacteria bacterium]
MAEITASMVKDLREKTGAGMMDCKKALTQTNGDLEAAVNWLREKGLAAAAKKAGRIAAEGLVGIFADGDVAALVEVNCETDFVAKNPDFQAFVKDLAGVVAKANPADVDALGATPFGGKTVKEVLTDKIATIGENMSLRRFARARGVIGSYSHMGGSIGVLVEFAIGDAAKASSETTKILAKDIAMQIAASSPSVLRREDADAKVIETEKNIAREKAKAEGKPEKILEKIADGAANKWFGENVLLEQAFVKDDKLTVQKHIDKVAKELGTTISVTAMHRFKVGEGLEKRSDDFAAEVAKMAGTG